MYNDYLSFDIELYSELPEGNFDMKSLIPSVAAIATNYEDIEYFENDPYMSIDTANQLVDKMLQFDKEGYKLLTWNGCSFDLNLLSQYSGRVEDCGRLALNHYDMMLLVVCNKGYPLSLDKALLGANIQGKLHNVILNDKSLFSEMTGRSAPILWRNKEFSAVKEYLRVDVEAPLKLARHIEYTKCIKWISNTGKNMNCFTDMLTVKECLSLPKIDTSWMKDPKAREDFYSWIPKIVLQSEGIL